MQGFGEQVKADSKGLWNEIKLKLGRLKKLMKCAYFCVATESRVFYFLFCFFHLGVNLSTMMTDLGECRQ